MSGSCDNAVKEGFEVRDDGSKHCGYCGSMDPVELAELIEAGKATMSGSDWKYGWPHKFYVDVANPHPDKQIVKCHGNRWNAEKQEYENSEEWGPQGPTLNMKFYSEHLGLLDDETFAKVAPVISTSCGITWERKEGKLYYTAPYVGYQKSK
jgi:hypothetical protein